MLNEYRNALIVAEQKSQDDYDKTIVSLSGGALGISLVFIKDIVGINQPACLWAAVSAWSLWACSIASVVASYFSSRVALRKAINQVDEGKLENIGGIATKVTQALNALSGALFILGISFFIVFAANNFGEKEMSDNKDVTKGMAPPPPPKIIQPPPTKPDGNTPPPPPPSVNNNGKP